MIAKEQGERSVDGKLLRRGIKGRGILAKLTQKDFAPGRPRA